MTHCIKDEVSTNLRPVFDLIEVLLIVLVVLELGGQLPFEFIIMDVHVFRQELPAWDICT